MELLKIALASVLFLGGAWWLSRQMRNDQRNQGSAHGGGWDGRSDGV